MDETWSYYVKINKYKYSMLPFTWGTHDSEIHTDKKVNWQLSEIGRKKECELLFNRHKVSIWEDEKEAEVDGANGCATMWMYLVSLNFILKKWLKMLNFMLSILCQNKSEIDKNLFECTKMI